MINKYLIVSTLMFFACALTSQSFWKKIDPKSIQLRSDDERTIQPVKYQTFKLDVAGLKEFLEKAPLESDLSSVQNDLWVEMPLSNGRTEMFKVYEAPSMMPGISARYPELKSYLAISKVDRSKKFRFSLSPNGFHAISISNSGDQYIDPYSEKDFDHYIVYDAVDHHKDLYKNIPMCGVEDEITPARGSFRPQNRNAEAVDLRVFKLAVACTGEWGRVTRRGTVAKCMDDINTLVTRLNAIYEKEMAMRFQLIDNNDKLVFIDPSSDPYNNSDQGKVILPTNTGVLNSIVGANSYDVGHVLSICFDIGGVAQGGSACQSNKGNGVTCNNDNDLSGIVTRVLAHEIGHQFDASHTWNRCESAADQRASGTAFEPGSGSTIMSYAGTCGSDNVVNTEDGYFHVGSLEQMYRKTRTGGNAFNCSDKVPSTNRFPVITKMPAANLTIPISTPFELIGEAEDEDGDAMTYCWEQVDAQELVTPLGAQNQAGPLFRTYKPAVTGDVRIIPNRDEFFKGNINFARELLPNVTRDLNFRLTVRDNNPTVGGVMWQDYLVKTTDQAGPFKVSFPDLDQKFVIGQEVTVTWDVANTDKAPVNCKSVNIFASYNAAFRNDDANLVPLALNVPNDGSQTIYIPNRTSNFFRIVIKAVDNIFLTSSRIPSRVDEPTIPSIFIETAQNFVTICQPVVAKIDFTTLGLVGYSGDINFQLVSGLPDGATANFTSNTIKAGETVSLNINTDNVVGSQSGQLLVRAIAPGVDTMDRIVNIEVVGGNLSGIQNQSPANGASNIGDLPSFEWSTKVDANSYEFQLATNPSFSGATLVLSREQSQNTLTSTSILNKSTIYYWRVRAKNSCGPGEWSEASAFITAALVCKVYNSGVKDIAIASSGSPVVEIPIAVEETGIAQDLNVKLVRAEHSRTTDLVAILVAPSGKESILWSRKCNSQNINVSLDDQSPNFFQCPINTGRLYRPENPLNVFNGEAIQGNWKLRLEDKVSGSGGRLQECNIELCANILLDPPTLVKNEVLNIYPGNKKVINDLLLLTNDNNNTANQLIYTIVTLPKEGSLSLNGASVDVGTTFTQADLNASLLLYSSNAGPDANDSFKFVVSDQQGGWIPVTQFNIKRDDDFVNAVENQTLALSVFIYPNPADQEITVLTSGEALALKSFEIKDISGRQLITGQLSGDRTVISLTDIVKGIYVLHLSDGQRSTNKKIVKL